MNKTKLSVLTCMIILFATLGDATVLQKRNFDELTGYADLVFIGYVTEIESEWGPGQKTILSHVTFSNLNVIKGQHPTDSIVIRMHGGTTDDIKIVVDGTPEFEIGEKRVIFLKGNNRFMCPIVGWWQGSFRVEVDNLSGKEIILDEFHNPIVEIKGADFIKMTRNVAKSAGIYGENQKVLAFDSGKRMTLDGFVQAIQNSKGTFSEVGLEQMEVPGVQKPNTVDLNSPLSGDSESTENKLPKSEPPSRKKLDDSPK